MLWIVAEIVQRNEEGQSQAHPDSLGSAAIDLAKSMFCLSAWLVCRQLQDAHPSSRALAFRDSPETHPGLPTHNVHAVGQGFSISGSCSDCPETMPVFSRHPQLSILDLTLGSVRSNLSIFVVALVYILRAYTVCAELAPTLPIHLLTMFSASQDPRVCRPFYSVSRFPCDRLWHSSHSANRFLEKFPIGFLACVCPSGS